jgi:transposase
MQRIGQDVAEKLDYQPGVFTVERHVRGKWACRCCQKLVQAPVPAHVIDKGIPTAGLLAQVLVAKFLDHLPLYRQERIFERAGHLIARSTLAQWVGECGAQLQPLVHALADELRRHVVLHADETPVAMLKPKHLRDGKTHKAYIWSYCTTSANPTKAVVFEFSETRSGENVREFLQAGHAQRLAGHAGDRRLQRLQRPHRQGRDLGAVHGARPEEVQRPVGQPPQRGRPQGAAVPPVPVQDRARDRGPAQQRGPIALGRSNWLFAGSLRAGKRAAAIMSLLHSARINGHDPYAYFKDVLERLPTHPASRIDELLPHRWAPAS